MRNTRPSTGRSTSGLGGLGLGLRGLVVSGLGLRSAKFWV